jgi:hypothetical protein
MRGRQKAEMPLVADLLARLQPYKAQGVVCRRCRTWVTEEEAQATSWSYWGGVAGEIYPCCPECAKHEYGLPLLRATGDRPSG